MMARGRKKDFYSTLTATYNPTFGGFGRVVRRRATARADVSVKIRVHQDAISALEATKQSVEAFGVEYISDLGWMITSVNNVKQDVSAGRYWKYFVNDQFVGVSVDKCVVNKGDTIDWRLIAE